MDGYRHVLEIAVRFKDVDMMGHVNHANYLTYVEDARLKYYDAVFGTNTDWHTQHGLIMARIEIDYKLAIRFDDIIKVSTKCTKLGHKSFEMEWIIAKHSNQIELIAAQGKAIIVCYDYELNKAIDIPAERRLMLTEYEGLR
ncbi:MAG TPA: acyl-CoA thioesterase [Saprospiraceae bacterium]|nr:acyl-CoA thioesterase [Saprospiraceae bacterium]